MAKRNSAAISPTAHYTGEVWRRTGLSHPALGTWQGRALHATARPLMAISRLVGGDTLEDFLLARHALIDIALERAILSGEIGQVVEVGSGMSPRGIRLTERHADLAYVEADLPGMAERKRAALRQAGSEVAERIKVADLDVLADPGDPQSLTSLVAGLDGGQGLAIVTEGLLNYFPRESVESIWKTIAAALSGFPAGVYVSDIHLAERNSGAIQTAFMAGLSVFVRGKVHLPFEDETDVTTALGAAGFAQVTLREGSEGGTGKGAGRVHVISARRTAA